MRPDVICLVAGGWSAGAVDLQRLPGAVIGVNEAAILIPCEIAVSMDRLWTTNRWPQLRARSKLTYVRDAAMKGNEDRPAWLRLFACDYRASWFSEKIGTLNGTNSGFCGLNLSYILRPRRLFLFGFDMNRSPTGSPYWHKPYEWAQVGGATKEGKYLEWAGQFDAAAAAFRQAGIVVQNVSATSAIQAFARTTPKLFEREFQ